MTALAARLTCLSGTKDFDHSAIAIQTARALKDAFLVTKIAGLDTVQPHPAAALRARRIFQWIGD